MRPPDEGSRQKRVAIFMHGLYGGGVERTMLNLAEGMASKAVAVDLVLVRLAGAFQSQIPANVHLVNLNAGRALSSFWQLVRYMRQSKPDAMLSTIHYTNLVAIWARSWAKQPLRLAVSEHDTFSVWIQTRPVWYRWAFRELLARFYPRADAVVGVSAGVADDLARACRMERERVRVIYNAVITPAQQQKARKPLEHPWFQAGEPPVVLAIGRLTEQKNFPLLLRAAARVRREQPLRLIILGEGEDRPALERLVETLGLAGDVQLPGFASNPYAYLHHAALFVLSSSWEGLPTVLIEALAYCRAVVSTNCPSGPAEILQGGKYGRLTPVGDEEALAEAIRAGINGEIPPPPPESWQPYSVSAIADQYLHLLLENGHA